MAFSGARRKRVFDEASLYEYAVASLGRRMRTVAELKRLMRARVEPGESGEAAIEGVVARLKEQKYLNDSRYAVAYSQYRQSNEKFGRRRVITDLKMKGVHAEVIEKAVASAYEEVNEEQLARQFLYRKRLKQPANEKESARVFRMLLRAGFASGTIFKILKQWNVDGEMLGVLESEVDNNAG